MRVRVFLVVLALLAGGCGSRVSGQDAGRAEARDFASGRNDTLAPNETGDDRAPSSPGDSTSTGAAGSGVAGGSSTRSGGAGGSGIAGPVGRGALTASSPGVTPTEIKVGLIYDKSAGSGNAAFGAAGVGQVDQKRAYDNLVADVNKRGGIGGRKLVPVYFAFDSADLTATVEVLEQKICTTFTETRVFVTFYGGQETFTRCMNKLRVVRIGVAPVDSQLLAESPLLIVHNVNLDRGGRFTTARLADRGFYQRGKNAEKVLKIGLVRYDDASHACAAKVVRDELAGRGLTLTDEVAIKEATGGGDVQDEVNALRAAALKFKSDDITHVQFLSEGRAFMELIFMQNAEKQLYHPRYGLNSTSGGQALATLLGGDAQSQLGSALQVGWFPIFDVQKAEYSGTKTTQAFQRCIKVLEDGGERFTGEGDPTRNKEAIAAQYCDQFNYLVAAAGAASPNLTPDTFMQQGAAAVGGLDSAGTFILSTTQRRDAYGGVKDGQFFDECTCFRYVNPTVHRV